MASSFCTKCGAPRDPGSRFCTKCGAPFNDEPITAPSSIPPNASSPQAQYQTATAVMSPVNNPTNTYGQGGAAQFVANAQQNYGAPASQGAQGAYYQAAQTTEPPKKTSRKGLIIGIVIALVVLAAAAAVIIFCFVVPHDEGSTDTTSVTSTSTSSETSSSSTSGTTGNSSATPSTEQNPYATPAKNDFTYSGAGNSYSILIPAGFKMTSSTNQANGGNTTIFTDDTTGMTIEIQKSKNSSDNDVTYFYNQAVSNFNPDYKAIFKDSGYFVYSYEPNNTVYYVKEYVGDYFYTLSMRYPKSAKETCDRYVEKIVDTFKLA